MMIMLTSLLLPGCDTLSSMQRDNSAWEGHQVDDLISSWGQPARTAQLGVDYYSYTWTSAAGTCEQTFLASSGRITGYSSSGCKN